MILQYTALFAFVFGVTTDGSPTRTSRSLCNQSNADAPREICMRHVGCFRIEEDFKNRLINFLPQERHVINTKLKLYTKERPHYVYALSIDDTNTIQSAPLNESSTVRFIVHGFLDSTFYGPWMEEMKNEFLLGSYDNVIIVDWSGGNGLPYTQATANTRVVGAEIAVLIQMMQKFRGIKPENCHIIGHSLGAHIAGYAGERLNKLGRISGLDPAEPFFQDMPPSVRLDRSDAEFVDVIHTDVETIAVGGLGMVQQVGHIDFYPNNGKKQPGCPTEGFKSIFTKGIIEGARRFIACNHQRAVDFFSNSINYKSIPQVAYVCTSWEFFIEGKCADCGVNNTRCAVMGIDAVKYKPLKKDDQSVKMYIQTGPEKPFWLYEYQIGVQLQGSNSKTKDQNGKLEITMHGTKNNDVFRLTNVYQSLSHGTQYRYLVTTNKDLGDIRTVTLKWTSSKLITIFSKPKLYVESIHIKPMNVYTNLKSGKKRNDYIYCNKKDVPIKAGEASYFNKNECN